MQARHVTACIDYRLLTIQPTLNHIDIVAVYLLTIYMQEITAEFRVTI